MLHTNILLNPALKIHLHEKAAPLSCGLILGKHTSSEVVVALNSVKMYMVSNVSGQSVMVSRMLARRFRRNV